MVGAVKRGRGPGRGRWPGAVKGAAVRALVAGTGGLVLWAAFPPADLWWLAVDRKSVV